MKSLKAFLKINAGVLLFFFVVISGGTNAYASPHTEMHEHNSGSSSNCQTRCANSSTVVVAPVPNEHEENNKPDPQVQETYGGIAVRLDSNSDKHRDTSNDLRLLRPPDLITLYCIYRI